MYASVSQAHAILLEGSDAYILSYGSGTMLKRDASGSLTTVATGMVNPAFFVLEEVCEAPVVKQGKVLVAHQTNSSKNPCVALQVNQNSLNDHLAHGDYVITCVDDACGGSNKMMTEEEWATEVKAIPNPVNDVVVFDFNSEAAGEVMFALYDLSGKHIQQLPSALLGDGQANMIQMRLDDLAAGSYIVRVGFSNGITKNIKLIKSE